MFERRMSKQVTEAMRVVMNQRVNLNNKVYVLAATRQATSYIEMKHYFLVVAVVLTFWSLYV